MVLVKNWPFFHFFFLGNIGKENVCYDILERKNVFLAYKNKKLKKSIKLRFLQGVNPWFWSKIGHFSIFYFLGNTREENVFYDILDRKTAFLGYKNNRFKKWNTEIFPKGLTHALGQKLAIFPSFFLGNIGQENVFYDIVERKNAFLGYKNKRFKKSKTDIFPKGLTHGLGQKLPIFQF